MSTEPDRHLGTLLAVMLGDGGQRQTEIGDEAAVAEAIDRYAELRAERDRLQATLVRAEHDWSGLLGDLNQTQEWVAKLRAYAGHAKGCSGEYGDSRACRCGWSDLDEEIRHGLDG